MSCFFGFQLVFVDCGPAMACPRLLAPSHVLPPTCYSAQLLIWYCFRYIAPLWYCLAYSHVFPRTHSFRAGLTSFLHLLLTSYPANVCTPWQGTGVLCIIRHLLFIGSEHVFLQDVCMHVIDWYNRIFMAKTYLILNTIEKYSWEHLRAGCISPRWMRHNYNSRPSSSSSSISSFSLLLVAAIRGTTGILCCSNYIPLQSTTLVCSSCDNCRACENELDLRNILEPITTKS